MSCTRQDQQMVRGVSKTFRVTVTDDNGDAIDLTGATCYFWVKTSVDAASATIAKTSGNVSEIEILSPATDGQFDVFLNPSDTQSLDPGTYYYDVLVQLASGDRHIVIKPSKLFLEQGVVDLSGPAPTTPGDPASQDLDARSFEWTVPSDGDSWTVAIPGSGMYDSEYCVTHGITELPTGGSLAILYVPKSSKAQTSFTLQSSGELLENTIIDFIVRDR